MNDNNIKIKLVNINKVFKTRRKIINALENINLEVREKEFVVIVGPSGCGKSTIIRIINDIIKPTSGEIYIDDYKYGTVVPREVVQKMGFIFQQPNLLPWLTVRENIEFPLTVLGQNVKQHSKYINSLLDMVKMKPFADLRPSELSGSMLKRAGVIRAMVHKPEILLMDEPFGQLDETMREQLDIELMDIWKNTEPTIIFITHNVEEAILLADRIFIMGTNPGTILKEVTVDFPRPRSLEILSDPRFSIYVDDITETMGELDLSLIK